VPQDLIAPECDFLGRPQCRAIARGYGWRSELVC